MRRAERVAWGASAALVVLYAAYGLVAGLARPAADARDGAARDGALLLKTLCVLAMFAWWSSLLYALTTHDRARVVLLGVVGGKPLRLPLVGALWSALTLGALVAWRSVAGAAPTAGLAHTYFRVGWSPTLVLMGIRVDRFWKYGLFGCYQLGRGFFVSLIDALFAPLVAEAQAANNAARDAHSRSAASARKRPRTPLTARQVYAKHDDDETRRYRRRVLESQLLAKLLTWWSTVTDVLFAQSQIDLALLPVLSTVAVNWVVTAGRIDERVRESEAAPAPPTAKQLGL